MSHQPEGRQKAVCVQRDPLSPGIFRSIIALLRVPPRNQICPAQVVCFPFSRDDANQLHGAVIRLFFSMSLLCAHTRTCKGDTSGSIATHRF